MRYNNFYQDKKKTAFFCRKYFQQNLASGGNHYERKHQKHAGAQKHPRLQKDLVPQETLDMILEAGEYSPSGMGQQSTLMVVTQNPELVAKLSKMNAAVMGSTSDPFYGAPTVIIVFSDSKMGTCVENGSLVMGNLMNAAHALDVDSCWIHRAKEVFDSEEGKELKKQWGVPDEYIGVGHCVLGYRDCEYPAAKPRKEGFVIRV